MDFKYRYEKERFNLKMTLRALKKDDATKEKIVEVFLANVRHKMEECGIVEKEQVVA